jgi:hypothetical protein
MINEHMDALGKIQEDLKQCLTILKDNEITDADKEILREYVLNSYKKVSALMMLNKELAKVLERIDEFAKSAESIDNNI